MRGQIGVFANYNSEHVGGGAIQNQNPNVHPYPWIPSQKKVRFSPVATVRGPLQVAGSTTQRITPIEKGKTWQTRNLGLGPRQGKPCSCGCGGGDSSGPGDRNG